MYSTCARNPEYADRQELPDKLFALYIEHKLHDEYIKGPEVEVITRGAKQVSMQPRE